MSVHYYLSTDAGAPAMTYNGAGTLLAVLRACLVDGYGSKSSAGWSMPYSSGTTGAFANAHGNVIKVADAGTNTSAGAVCTGGSAIYASGGLTDAYGPVYAPRGQGSNAPVWAVVADQDLFYLSIVGGSYGALICFGLPAALDPSDTYATLLCGIQSSSSDVGGAGGAGRVQTSVTSTQSALYVARSYDQASIGYNQIGLHTDSAKNGGGDYLGYGGLSYPNAPDAGVYFAPVWMHETKQYRYVRSLLPGLWCPMFSAGDAAIAGIGHHNILSPASGDLAGRSLLFLLPISSNNGCAAIEISDTWR